MAVNNALVSDCAIGRESAHRALALDHSIATVPNAALALAICGETGAPSQEMQRLVAASPNNTLATEIYLPEVKAATAIFQHHPESVADLLTATAPYPLVSKAPLLLGNASLARAQWQQAVNDFAPGLRYHGLALEEVTIGNGQAPPYALCLLGTARAQSHLHKAASIRSYQQLLEIWKSADANFIPAQEAKRELAALQK
jgi:eukaryotic-like serine/threonine-protein kinase